MAPPLAEVVDVFHAMVKVTQHALEGLAQEAEKVTSACNNGEEIAAGIRKILQKLSAATTRELIVEALDEADSQIEAAEEWIEQSGIAHPDVSTIHLAAKVSHQV